MRSLLPDCKSGRTDSRVSGHTFYQHSAPKGTLSHTKRKNLDAFALKSSVKYFLFCGKHLIPQHCFFAVRRFFNVPRAKVQICAQPCADMRTPLCRYAHTPAQICAHPRVEHNSTLCEYAHTPALICAHPRVEYNTPLRGYAHTPMLICAHPRVDIQFFYYLHCP